MEELFKWCNDNQGVLAAVAILVVVVPAMLKIISKTIKHFALKNHIDKAEKHNSDLEAIIDYLKDNIVANTTILAQKLNKSEDEIVNLLSELIDQGIIIAACDNCDLSNPNSVWELRR